MDVDLTNCDREPIHELGFVQSFGCLVAVSPDWLVMHASENTAQHLGIEARDMIGLPLRDLVSPGAIHDIRSEVQTLSTPNATGRRYGLQVLEGRDTLFNVALHRAGRYVVLEFEPVSIDMNRREGTLSQVRGMIERLKAGNNQDKLCGDAARFIKILSGFDRVMVYRFASDDTGEVIAEALAPGMEPFLGLRYPASDIPKQARELYKRSPIRIISDVEDPLSPIVPVRGATGDKLDLSLSTLRAVSPIHLEYLRNMGVAASMSISIMDGDRLWGLFACHHRTPRTLDYATRSSCDLFGQMFGFVLAQMNSRLQLAETQTARRAHDSLMVQLAEGGSIIDDFEVVVDALVDLIRFDGAAAWIDGKFTCWGHAPTEEEVLRLARFLNTTEMSTVFATDSLRSVFPPAADFGDRCAGVMALPVSRTPRDYVMFFRRGIAKTVTWAGNPEKPVTFGPNGVRLTPRKSFEAWTQITEGTSAEWTAGERQVAETIRVTLLEVVLRLSDAANAERKRAQEKQELLVAELNHRVRNILNLIRGLVAQGRSESVSVAEFTEVVGDRIHALARAHDQITNETWNATSFIKMVQTELAAYLGDRKHRVRFVGTDAVVQPEALSTLALVFHELTTNSAKYGALTDGRGTIEIELTRDPGDGLAIHWTESGGPAVKPPLRRGFGSTIIERSIPFELGGRADVSYPLTGVRAEFYIPARHVKAFAEQASEPAPGTETAPGATPASLPAAAPLTGEVLLVEDNLIIALDSETMLHALGAVQVHTASSVHEALAMLDKRTIDCAVLDLNLGTETSLPVADALVARGIPFTFATGYGEAKDILAAYDGVPVLTKPYDRPSLEAALARAFAAKA